MFSSAGRATGSSDTAVSDIVGEGGEPEERAREAKPLPDVKEPTASEILSN